MSSVPISASKPSFFITLIEMTDANRRDLESVPRVHSMIHHGLTLAEYRAFLHDLYHVVWHFCPVMAAAAARCDDRFRDVRYELYERIQEEKGHEAWVLEDIEAIGGDVASARSGAPSAPVQAMIGFNYYSAERVHPCSVLGMLYMLEVVSSVYGGRVSDAIARALGRSVDGGGFKFLSSHATMDQDHMASLNRLVKTIADPEAQQAVINSTRVNFVQFAQMFGDNGFAASAG
ncbi:MAG TPA: iron-containing redox enzyme family protein [Burkholderiales bacterium]|nr:iron-containing redox enzyme family protein [Burkholderiales bacterium]